MKDRTQPLGLVAFAASLVATLGSLNFSGIGPLAWRGMGLFPCELCWYQRILMYPIPILLGIAVARNEVRRLAPYVLALAVPGAFVAAYHILVQRFPQAEAGQCFVGACTSVDWALFGVFTIPQLALVAFTIVTAAMTAILRS